MVEPEIRAEDFSVNNLKVYEPVGEACGLYIKIFNDYLKKAMSEDFKPRLIVLEGRYGMGKTLLVRKSLLAFENYLNMLPVYIPIRRLGNVDPRYFDRLREEKYKIKDANLITYSLMYWRDDCEAFLGKDPWNIEVPVNGRRIKRISVLNNVIELNPKDVQELIKIINEQGFIPVIAIDELEAFILRDTREKHIVRGLQQPIVSGVIANIYGWLTGDVKGKGLVVIASALSFETDDWLRIPLQEYARYRASAGLEELLRNIFGVPQDAIERVKSSPQSIVEKEIDDICRRYATFLPFRNPSVVQTLRSSYVKLRYRAEDYEKLFQRFNIEVVHSDITRIFEVIELSMRTTVDIAKNMVRKGFRELTYKALAGVLTDGANECYKVDSLLKQSKIVPSHTKAIVRICNLLGNGIIAVDKDISLSLYYEKLPEKDRVELQEDFRRRLCKALQIEHCDPWSPSVITKILDRIKSIQLMWKLIKVVSILGMPEYFVIDETLLRWALGDPYDLLGNNFDLKTYFENIIKERKARSER